MAALQYYNSSLCVSAAWLFENSVITKPTYDKLQRVGDIRLIRRGCRNTPALVDFESLPDRFKSRITALVEDVYKVAKTNMLEEYIEPSPQTGSYFEQYELADGRRLPAEKRREYYANAMVLTAISRMIESNKRRRAAMGKRPIRNWEGIAAIVADLDRKKWPHTLPTNPRSLEKKYQTYQRDGNESLIHKLYINQCRNAAKIKDEKNESLLAALIADPQNLDNAQVARFYNTLAEGLGWPKITASAVAVWRDKLDNVVFAGRRGAKAYSNSKAMQVKRKAPTYPLYFWTLDGWDVELLYQEKKPGKATAYTNRPTCVFVLDACCKYPIGYAIGTHETPELIKSALRNAAQHTAELFGTMYRVQQVQADRYAQKKMIPLYTGVSEYATLAGVGNAKAKIIEPWFKMINKKYCQLHRNWSGFGVTSKKSNQPNVEFLNKNKHKMPDFNGVCEQIHNFVAQERAELRDQYMAKFNEMPKEHLLPMSRESYLLMYGETSGNKILLNGSGINPTIRGQKRYYDCFNLDFRNHSSTRWEVRYDPDDLTTAIAVNADESRIFLLEEKHIQPMALIERQAGDVEELNRVRDFNKDNQALIVDKLCNYQETAQLVWEEAQEMIEDKKRLDVLSKLLITDSRGQHKIKKAEARQARKKDLVSSAQDVFEVQDDADDLSNYFNKY